MIYALNKMLYSKHGEYIISARQYEYIKKLYAKVEFIMDDATKIKISKSNKGRIKTKDHIEKIFEKRENNGQPWHTEETKNKIAEALRKKYENGELTPNKTTFKKGSKPWNTDPNRKFSEQSRKKMSESHKGKKPTHTGEIIQCPHCQKIGGYGISIIVN